MTEAGETATTVVGPAIVVDHVTKTFELNGRPLEACSEVSFTVEVGEFVTIIGPSGCGKSTLLRLIADLLAPTRGRVLIDGLPAREARLERKLGMVFQDAVLLPWRSVLRNVELPLQVSGVDSRTRRERAQQLVELVGLGGFEKARPRALSGGMARRAAIARALVMEPSILLMDEPFGALDEITRQSMNQALLEIWSRTETTALLVTHSVSEAVFLSDRVLVMSARPGRIRADIPIGLPRPRSVDLLQNEEFFKASARLLHELTEVVNAGVEESFPLTWKPTAVAAIVFYGGLVGLWFLVAWLLRARTGALPSPIGVYHGLDANAGVLASNVAITLEEAALGLLIGFGFGVLVAAIAALLQGLGDAILALCTALYSLPVIAIAPLLVIWLGSGSEPKVIIAALSSFFPIAVLLTQGLRSPPEGSLEAFSSIGAGRRRAFVSLRLPSAAPSLLAGLKVAAPAAVIGALHAEWVGADRGLGIMMLYAMYGGQSQTVWATLVVATAAAVVGYGVFASAERLLRRWY